MQAVTFPHTVVKAGSKRRLPLDLFLFKIHRRGAIVDLAKLLGHAGVEQHGLNQRCFTGAVVRHNPQISQFCSVVLTHESLLFQIKNGTFNGVPL